MESQSTTQGLSAMNKIILYIATSLDGFIADIHGGVDWLPHPKDDVELETVGYNALMSRIDTILMGSRSYKQILSFGDWGWPDKKTYVFTSKQLEIDKPYISKCFLILEIKRGILYIGTFKNLMTSVDDKSRRPSISCC